jgi:hypothetical protein
LEKDTDVPPEILVQSGKAYLTHPWTGETVAVPKDQVMGLLSSGMAPAGEQGYRQAWQREFFGGTSGAVAAGLLGAMRGASFGLTDLALREAGAPAAGLAGLSEANPTATMVGELGGTVAGGFIPGGPLAQLAKGAGKVGTAVTGLTARALSKSAGAAAPRLAGAIAREGLLGGAFGAGQGISGAALTQEELGGLEILSSMAKKGGEGALFGMGLGALGAGAGIAGRKVASRWTRGTEELKRLRGEQQALRAEREALTSSGAGPAAIERLDQRLASVSTAVKEQQVKVAGQVFSKAVGMGIGSVLGGGMGGGALGYILAPSAARALKRALKPIGGRIGALGERLKERVAPWAAKAGGLLERGAMAVEGAAPGSVQAAGKRAGAAVGRAGRWAGERIPGAETPLGQGILETAGHAVGTAAAMAPDKVVAGFMMGGVHGATLAAGAHLAKEYGQEALIRNLSQALTTRVFPAAKKSVFDVVTGKDLEAFLEELHHMDSGPELEAVMAAQFPTNTPQELQGAISRQLGVAIGYLQQTTRPPAPQGIPTGADRPRLDERERRQTLERLEAVLSPDRVLERLGEGKLTATHVEAMGAVYPQALAQLRSVVRAEVERVRSSGGHYQPERADQIATLLGEGGPRLTNPQTIARLQAIHQARREAQRSMPPRRRSVRVADMRETAMQRIRGRLS